MLARSWILSLALFCLALTAVVLVQGSDLAAARLAPGAAGSPALPPGVGTYSVYVPCAGLNGIAGAEPTGYPPPGTLTPPVCRVNPSYYTPSASTPQALPPGAGKHIVYVPCGGLYGNGAAQPPAYPSPRPTPTSPACQPGFGYYTVTTSTGATIVPGTNDVGNHCDDCITDFALPFPVRLYDYEFAGTAAVSSNGTLSFTCPYPGWYGCLPDSWYGSTVFAHLADMVTSGAGNGIYSSISGTAPDRTLHMEWRTRMYDPTSPLPINFEVRLHENSPDFEIIYATLYQNGSVAAVGVQKDLGDWWTEYSCHAPSLDWGVELAFTYVECGTATPTVTGTPPTLTPSQTASRTATRTATRTASRTSTPSLTPTPSRTPTPSQTPTPSPTLTDTPTPCPTHLCTPTVTPYPPPPTPPYPPGDVAVTRVGPAATAGCENGALFLAALLALAVCVPIARRVRQ